LGGRRILGDGMPYKFNITGLLVVTVSALVLGTFVSLGAGLNRYFEPEKQTTKSATLRHP
jgi:hypothetical protein